MKYDKLTVAELKQLAKNKQIKGYSKLNKDDLIALLKKHKNKKVYVKGGDCWTYHIWKRCTADNHGYYCSKCKKKSETNPTPGKNIPDTMCECPKCEDDNRCND